MKLMKVSQLCQILKISKQAIHMSMKKGKMKYYRIGGTVRVSAEQLDNYRKRAQN